MRDQVCWPSPSTSWTKLFFYLVKQVIYHNLDTLIKIDKMTRLGKKHRGRSALPKGTSIKHFWAIFSEKKMIDINPTKFVISKKVSKNLIRIDINQSQMLFQKNIKFI